MQLQFRGPARQNIIRREFDERSLVNYCTWALVHRQPAEKRCTQNSVLAELPRSRNLFFSHLCCCYNLERSSNYEDRDAHNYAIQTLLLSKDSSRNSNCFSSKREKKPRQKLNQPTKIDSNIKDNPLRRTTATRAVLSIPFLLSQTVRLSLSPFLISSRKLTTTVHGWQQ